MDISRIRQALLNGGFLPIPVRGKRPPFDEWQKVEATEADIADWARSHPNALNTGILTRATPALDVDILHPEAAEAVEALCRSRFEELGIILVRIGRSPKRAILFRTDEVFAKITANLIAGNEKEPTGQKLEFLSNGQQLVCFGIHPDTRKPYGWFGGEPGKIKRENLPHITGEQAEQLVKDAVELLEEFGYKPAPPRPRDANGDTAAGAADWGALSEAIRKGHALHDNLRDLAAKLVASGMAAGAAVNLLRSIMDQCEAAHDARWKARRDDIPRLVSGAVNKQKEPQPAVEPCQIDKLLHVFSKWLVLDNPTPLYAMLGVVAGNLLPGDPIWLGIVAPPSSAKTELLNSLSKLPHTAVVETLTPAALLSGSPKRDKDKHSTGGVLRQIGAFGFLIFKDFGGVLDLRHEQRSEMLSALRRIFDGEYIRVVGADGGRQMKWSGKVGLLFAATQKYDSYHVVIGTLGDRFLLTRLEANSSKQFAACFKHIGVGAKKMRGELADAVAGLFATLPEDLEEPEPLSDSEMARLEKVVMLAVRLRGGVERDRIKRDIESVHDPEGPARLALSLERLFMGLVLIGLGREHAMAVVEKVTMDSTPRFRRKVYDALKEYPQTTRQIATAMELPTTTTRHALEELVAQGLANREEKEQGADQWSRKG